jgi:hypothetical protein
MKRVEKYRESRYVKRKFILSFLLFFSLTIIGLCASDYSVNNILKNEKKIKLVCIEKKDSNIYKLDILNKSIEINTTYISRDYDNLKKALTGLIH